MTYILIFLNIFLLASGQMFWKRGIASLNYDNVLNLIKFVFTPYIFIGLILYGIATLIWLYLLKTSEFSLIYPLQSLAYVIGVVLAFFIFKDEVSVLRWIGIIIICLGAYVVAKG